MWNDAAVNVLRTMWEQGDASAATIAKALGSWCTRNAVIGKAHRLGLRPRAKTDVARTRASRKGGRKRAKAIRAARRRSPSEGPAVRVSSSLVARRNGALRERAMADDAPQAARKGLLELVAHDCRWPMSGSGAETVFCGAHAADGGPYCATHNARAWQPQDAC